MENVEAELNTHNFVLSYKKDGKLLFADRAPLAYNFQNEFGNGTYHYLTREKGEKIYGLGDKGGSVNKAGRTFRIETSDSMGYDAETSDPLYKHVPFYMCENSVGCYARDIGIGIGNVIEIPLHLQHIGAAGANPQRCARILIRGSSSGNLR